MTPEQMEQAALERFLADYSFEGLGRPSLGRMVLIEDALKRWVAEREGLMAAVTAPGQAAAA